MAAGKAKKVKVPKKAGRPSSYTEAMGDFICEQLMEGRSLRDICAPDDMPNRSSVFRWIEGNESFRNQYTRAREEQADYFADDIVNIADEVEFEPIVVDGETVAVKVDSTAVARNRLRVDARKWVASKLKPKRYGDKIQHADANGDKLEPAQFIFQPVAPAPKED